MFKVYQGARLVAQFDSEGEALDYITRTGNSSLRIRFEKV